MRELTLRNRQRTRKLNIKLLRELTRALLEDLLKVDSYELGIEFVSAEKMARLNKKYLDHEGSTDVLTFDWRAIHPDQDRSLGGDVYICVDEALEQARAFATTWPEEIARYIVHAVLHLRGHDDLAVKLRRRMKDAENRLMRLLARRFAFKEIAG